MFRCLAIFGVISLFIFSCKKKDVKTTHGEIIFLHGDVTTNATGDTIYAVLVPNAFSPNGDGLNEYFYAKTRGVDASSF